MFNLSVGSICSFARRNPRAVSTIERMIAALNHEAAGALIQPLVGARLWLVPVNQRRCMGRMLPAYIRDIE